MRFPRLYILLPHPLIYTRQTALGLHEGQTIFSQHREIGYGAGYQYAAAGTDRDMRAFAKALNTALTGRGGGSASLIQGSVRADADAVRAFFAADAGGAL